jgi:hypothetical protein
VWLVGRDLSPAFDPTGESCGRNRGNEGDYDAQKERKKIYQKEKRLFT